MTRLLKLTWSSSRTIIHDKVKSPLSMMVKMESDQRKDLLKPPAALHMKTLDRDFFKKTITVPCLKIEHAVAFKLGQIMKPLLMKMPHLPPARNGEKVEYFLNPCKISGWSDLDEKTQEKLKDLGVTAENIHEISLELKYENWNADEIMRAVLPIELPIARSFSVIGHILHLNLRDRMLDYKNIIGQILLDKTARVKTVVNKTTSIDNTFRNFSMELICGEDQMVTQVAENGIKFEFDFSQVYWNPRLSTEHQRITDSVSPGDVLFDVFCGVGPFALPCAKKKCRVFANDLNPQSFHWLNHNIKMNKIKSEFIETYNKDGAAFILQDVKENIRRLSKEEDFVGEIHITMNLPAMALEFVKNFRGLWSSSEIDAEQLKRVLPKIHTYFFVVGNDAKSQAVNDFAAAAGVLYCEEAMTYSYVRNVSTMKDMVKISWTPPVDYLIGGSGEEPPCKKSRDAEGD